MLTTTEVVIIQILGVIYSKLKRSEEAIADFTKVIEL
jgi:hypothetical protein